MEFVMVVLRTSLAFLALLALAKILGKKQISQLSFFDYISGIFIGVVAAGFAANIISITAGITSIILWSLFMLGKSYVVSTSVPARKLIDEQATILIQNGKILEQNMTKIQYSLPDLLMQLRINGVFEPDKVEFALLETNGKLSVLKKSQYRPITPHDLDIPTNYEGLVTELVVNGQVQQQKLTQVGLSDQWLQNELTSQGITNVSDVVLATLGTDGKLYVDKKFDSFLDINGNTQPL